MYSYKKMFEFWRKTVKLKNGFPVMNTFCLFGLNKWHFKKLQQYCMYVVSSSLLLFLLPNLIMQWWAHLFPILFYATDNAKKILKFTTLV